MSVRSPLSVSLIVAVLSVFLATHVSAQDPPPVEAVAVTLTPLPSGNLTVPGTTGVAKVEVAAVCKLPSALAPGLVIEHSAEMDSTLGSAEVKPASQTVAFEPAQCADGTPTTYTVDVEFSFVQTAPYDQPVKIVFTSQPKLEGNPSTSAEWEERPDVYGTLDVQQEYNASVRTGAANEVGFWLINKLTNSAVEGSAVVTTSPGLGTVTFSDGATVDIGEKRLFRLIYTPDKEGTDRFVADVQISIGDRLIQSKNLTYEVLSDPDADASRIDPGVRNSPGPGVLAALAAVGVLGLLRRKQQNA